MNKKIVYLFTLLIMTLATVNPVFAQENSTDSADEKTTKNLKTRIEKVVQENREKIKGVIEKIAQHPRGFVGEVQRISEESITIVNSKGVQIIPIDEQVSILKNDEEIELSEIEIENWVVVMGLEAQDNFSAKRIIVSDDNLNLRDYFVQIGAVKSITNSEIEILPRSSQENTVYDLTRNTVFQDLNGDEMDSDLIEEEIQILIVGYKTEDGNIATKIRSLAVIEDEN